MTPHFERLRGWWADLCRVLETQPPPAFSRRPPELRSASRNREPGDTSDDAEAPESASQQRDPER
jgi:hypothetical protein